MMESAPACAAAGMARHPAAAIAAAPLAIFIVICASQSDPCLAAANQSDECWIASSHYRLTHAQRRPKVESLS
jgi:hypothetical protein